MGINTLRCQDTISPTLGQFAAVLIIWLPENICKSLSKLRYSFCGLRELLLFDRLSIFNSIRVNGLDLLASIRCLMELIN